MTDMETVLKKLEDVELELFALRCRNTALEVVFMTLWQVSFVVSVGKLPQQLASFLKGITSTLHTVLADGMRSDSISEEEREHRLEKLAQTMKKVEDVLCQTLSLNLDDPPQETE